MTYREELGRVGDRVELRLAGAREELGRNNNPEELRCDGDPDTFKT